MRELRGTSGGTGATGGSTGNVQLSPGKQTLVDAHAAVQQRGGDQAAGSQQEQVRAHAEAGLAEPAGKLPHRERIEAAFGRHDVSGIQAHVGGAATEASQAMGAEAYATGNHVAFGAEPDLHTAAHEAAHVVQQRAGVALKGGVGEAGDSYEQHADAVADAVVAGRSAEPLLDRMAPSAAGSGGGSAGGAIQHKNLKQAGLDTGLTESGTGDLVNYTKKGKEYTETLGDAVSDRTAALVKAGERNAIVGNRTVGKTWTGDGATWNKNDASTLDPFRFKVTLPFTNSEDGDKPHSLSLVYQHGHLWTGYVTSIEDSSNTATTGGVTMYNSSDGKKRGTDKFSNVHGTGKSGTVSEQTEGDKHHNLDAYTKIAGEGARWKCVRNHASAVKDTSLFFVAHATDKTKAVGVTFVDLWKNWKNAFGKRYDIPDADVATSIKTGFLKDLATVKAVSALTGNDYNLTTSKAHGS